MGECGWGEAVRAIIFQNINYTSKWNGYSSVHSYLNRFAKGSTIAFTARARPPIATNKAVIFSIKAVIFDVLELVELKSLP